MEQCKKMLERYIQDSMENSGGQTKCSQNLRRYLTRQLGNDSPLIWATDLLHHPKFSYRKRVLKKYCDLLIKLDLFDLWESAENANLGNDLHKLEGETFIPRAYFFDLKFFFLDLMFLKFFFDQPQEIVISEMRKDDEIITLKKNGFSIMFEREEKLLLINLEKGNVNFFEDLRRGMHFPIKRFDPLIIRKLKTFGIT